MRRHLIGMAQPSRTWASRTWATGTWATGTWAPRTWATLRRTWALAAVAAVSLAAAACTSQPGTSPTGTAPTGTATATSTAGQSTGTAPTPPTSEPTASGLESRVSYDWAVPASTVTINHPITAPIAAPPAPPLPYLVGIYVGNHPEGTPRYQRISFYFRGAFPSYRFGYVPQVLSDGSGLPVPLLGNSFVDLVFVDAQAHDNGGVSTVAAAPPNPIGFPNLKSYAAAGDFEGHVTYGLGVQNAGSDQQIRVGELKKPDGSGGFFYVVYFDLRTG